MSATGPRKREKARLVNSLTTADKKVCARPSLSGLVRSDVSGGNGPVSSLAVSDGSGFDGNAVLKTEGPAAAVAEGAVLRADWRAVSRILLRAASALVSVRRSSSCTGVELSETSSLAVGGTASGCNSAGEGVIVDGVGGFPNSD